MFLVGQATIKALFTTCTAIMACEISTCSFQLHIWLQALLDVSLNTENLNLKRPKSHILEVDGKGIIEARYASIMRSIYVALHSRISERVPINGVPVLT